MLVVLVALVVAGVVTRPDPPGDVLLGRMDGADGRTSTVAPPTGLRTAWAHDIGGSQIEGHHDGGPLGAPVVRGGRALVAGVVVELATGAVVADLREDPFWGAMGAEDGVVSLLEGGHLAIIDALTGQLLRRAELDLDDAAVRSRNIDRVARVRGAEASLVAIWDLEGLDQHGYGGWALLGDDGSLVATGVGFPDAWFNAHGGDSPYATIVRPTEGEDPSSPSYAGDQRVVIDLSTGDEVLVVAQGHDASGMDLVGRYALVSSRADRAPPDVDGFPWDVELVDLRTGQVVRRAQLSSSDRPVLLSATPEGDPVVALRRGDQVEVVVLEEEGRRSVLDLPVDLRAPWYADTVAKSVTASDGRVVVTLDEDGTVTASGLDGTRRWRHEAGTGRVVMALGDAHVALATDTGQTRRLQLLRVRDGAVVTTATIPSPPGIGPQGPQPAAVVDGLVAVTVQPGDRHGGSRSLQAVDWFELTGGRERALADVAEEWRRSGLLGPETWPPPRTPQPSTSPTPDPIESSHLLRQHLLGTMLGGDGRTRPLIGRFDGDGELELLGGDGRLHTIDVPVPGEAPRGATDSYGWVVGGSGSRVVLGRELHGGPELQDGPVLLVADLEGGEAVTVPRIHGLRVVGGVALGVPAWQEDPALVAIDLRTGEERWRIDDQRWDWRLTGDERDLVLVDVGAVTLRDTKGGEVRWHTELERLLSGTAVLTPAHVVVATRYGEVMALDRGDGTVAWEAAVGAPVTTLTGAGEHVLLGTAAGQVVHLGPDGRELERLTVGPSSVSSVAALGDTVVAVVGQRVIGLRVDGDGLTERDEVDLP